VDHDSGSHLFDIEHDTPSAPVRPIPIDLISDYQRLVVNPMLTILGLLSGIVLIKHALAIRNLLLFGTAVGVLFLPFLLIQFHCLDCGATSWYYKSRRHACLAVVDRFHRKAYPRRVIRARTQLILWTYVLVAAGFLWAVFALGRL
jgi:hypothetical protein